MSAEVVLLATLLGVALGSILGPLLYHIVADRRDAKECVRRWDAICERTWDE